MPNDGSTLGKTHQISLSSQHHHNLAANESPGSAREGIHDRRQRPAGLLHFVEDDRHICLEIDPRVGAEQVGAGNVCLIAHGELLRSMAVSHNQALLGIHDAGIHPKSVVADAYGLIAQVQFFDLEAGNRAILQREAPTSVPSSAEFTCI